MSLDMQQRDRLLSWTERHLPGSAGAREASPVRVSGCRALREWRQLLDRVLAGQRGRSAGRIGVGVFLPPEKLGNEFAPFFGQIRLAAALSGFGRHGHCLSAYPRQFLSVRCCSVAAFGHRRVAGVDRAYLPFYRRGFVAVIACLGPC